MGNFLKPALSEWIVVGILCLLLPVMATWYYGQRHLYRSAEATVENCHHWHERISHYVHNQGKDPHDWQDLINGGYLPPAFVNGSGGKVMSNPWGGEVAFVFIHKKNQPTALQFHFSGIHKNQCPWLASAFEHEKATGSCREGGLTVGYDFFIAS